MKTVIAYCDNNNDIPFEEWLYSLRDAGTKHRILARLRRVEQGNYGDHKRFSGLVELRCDFGKGYRIYCGEDGEKLVILLIGGDKSSQEKDIKKAISYWEDYHAQKKL